MISYQISDTVIRVEAQRKWVSESGRYLGERFQVEKIESSKVLRIVCVYYAGGKCFCSRMIEEKNGNGVRERARRQITKSLIGSKED